MSLDTIKNEFPVLSANPTLVYLDSVASSQTPQCVLDVMNEYYTQYRANVHRGLYAVSETASTKYEEAREIVARFVGSDPEEIVFTAGSTASANQIVRALEDSLYWEEGGAIVVSNEEHHGIFVPLQQLAKRKKAEFHIESVDVITNVITPGTKIVAVTLVSNVLGGINEVRSIIKKAHDVGAIVIVDAAQAVGHMPVDFHALECDFAFFSGHKMCGPTGIGVLYGKADLLEQYKPGIYGGGAVSEVDDVDTSFAKGVTKWEPGTPNIAGAVGLAGAAVFLQEIGVDEIFVHSQELALYAQKELEKIKELTLFAKAPNAGIISFTIDGIHPHDVAQIFARKGVAVRAGHHCAQPLMRALGVVATTRASFYLYNTKNDVDLLVQALLDVTKTFA